MSGKRLQADAAAGLSRALANLSVTGREALPACPIMKRPAERRDLPPGEARGLLGGRLAPWRDRRGPRLVPNRDALPRASVRRLVQPRTNQKHGRASCRTVRPGPDRAPVAEAPMGTGQAGASAGPENCGATRKYAARSRAAAVLLPGDARNRLLGPRDGQGRPSKPSSRRIARALV